MHGSVSTYSHHKFVIFFNQSLSDIHSMSGSLSLVQIHIEPGVHEGLLKIVPLLER